MIRVLLFLFVGLNLLFCEEIKEVQEPRVNCLILEDENSIICKFEIQRYYKDREITIQWINPQKEISRERQITIPARHGSIYDYRYIKGRENGIWTFNVILEDKSYSTNFKLR